MARGWESKAVEAQLEETEMREEEQPRSEWSPEVRARNEKRESLRLSRSRTLEQLERATNQSHRAMLERTLRALEREMAELN
jgi:hypothetical protein